MKQGSVTIFNNSNKADSKNKNISIIELDLSIKDNDYVRLYLEKFWVNFISLTKKWK